MHNLKHIYRNFTGVIGPEVHLLLTEFCKITVEMYFFVSHTLFTVHVMNSVSVVTRLLSGSWFHFYWVQRFYCTLLDPSASHHSVHRYWGSF